MYAIRSYYAPDGRQVAYLSDRSGEYQVYLRAADGGVGHVQVADLAAREP